MAIKGILFDFIGTTVMEKDPEVINRCFQQAFADHGLQVSDQFIKANRGRDKKEVITAALAQRDLTIDLIEPVLSSFQMHLENNLDNFSENTGAKETIAYLKEKGIIVGLGTGLPRGIFEQIRHHLRLDEISFDYIGVAGEIGRGRPHPDMVLDMLQKCLLQNDELLKVGDTVADIQEGKNANVITAAILSGTQEKDEIIALQPDFIIHSLSELKQIVK